MTTPLTCDVEAGESFFGVRFRPGMAAAFMREAALLTDKVEPLENIRGVATRLIFERLAESSTAEEMAKVMEGVLRPVEPPDPAQQALWRLSATVLLLDRLAPDAGLSERHFRRARAERAGVSPVKGMRTKVTSTAQPNWAQLAAACGYYDQAHLIREFQEFAGSTPGRFLQSRARCSGLRIEKR